ncbi:helix-hairpin-helix domain-containing protein [Acholeplasma equifetale]|uniref:helix-hairpin-helix domain-containing protein n=1 Tax=Acholeplasma equifetale TaxID=264634 RepID=UPI00047AD1A4|nr:helix-hairpin-helix domain-containing protein [Acholeplasma equifetale]
MKYQVLKISFILFILLCIYFFPRQQNKNYYELDQEIISVKIDGAVLNPGIYQVNKSDRLGYLIHLAGGLREDADISSISFNQYLTNSEYYIEYIKFEKIEPIIKYDLNSINYDTLLTIPYITESRALNILLYRQEKKFDSIDELLNVKGIGEKTFEKIKGYFKV